MRSTFAVSSLYVSAQDNDKKVVNGGHGLDYYQMTGDVLDPTGGRLSCMPELTRWKRKGQKPRILSRSGSSPAIASM